MKETLRQKGLTEILSQQFEVKTEVLIEGTQFNSSIQFEYDGDKSHHK